MKKRVLAFAAILALTAGGLAGCGGSKEKGSGSSDPGKLKFGFNFLMKRLKERLGPRLWTILMMNMPVNIKL